MATFRHLPMSCPMCGYKMDAVSTSDDQDVRSPEPGDPTICMRCTSVLQFSESGLQEVDVKARLEYPDALWDKLQLAGRAGEHITRDKHFILDTVITRGPGDYRAAVTMKNGLFIVSAAQNTRKKAERLLRRARAEQMLLVRFAQVDDVPEPGFYGQIFLSMFGQEFAVAPYAGPFASPEQGKPALVAQGKELAARLGMPVRGIFEIDGAKTPSGGRN